MVGARGTVQQHRGQIQNFNPNAPNKPASNRSRSEIRSEMAALTAAAIQRAGGPGKAWSKEDIRKQDKLILEHDTNRAAGMSDSMTKLDAALAKADALVKRMNDSEQDNRAWRRYQSAKEGATAQAKERAEVSWKKYQQDKSGPFADPTKAE